MKIMLHGSVHLSDLLLSVEARNACTAYEGGLLVAGGQVARNPASSSVVGWVADYALDLVVESERAALRTA